MTNSLLNQQMKNAAQSTKDLMNGSVVSTVAINAVIVTAFGSIIVMINSLQLIFHLPIMSIVTPGNVMTMFQIMIPVVMFDIMESIDFFKDLFPYSEDDMQ